MNEACDVVVALSEDGKVVTIFITPPVGNDDTVEYAAGKEEANPEIVHFSRNMPEAEAEIVMNEAGRNTPNKKQKQTKKKQYKWLKGDLKKNSEIYNFL